MAKRRSQLRGCDECSLVAPPGPMGAHQKFSGHQGFRYVAGPPDDLYWAWHRKLDNERGKARTFNCASCQAPALDWALKEEHVTPDMLGQRVFVEDLQAYEPLCRKCHLTRDRAGVVFSDETRARMSESQKRRFATQGVSEATRAKLSKANKGKTRSPEQRENYRQAALRREAAKRRGE